MFEQLKQNIAEAFLNCYSIDVKNELTILKTRKEFNGDYTINIFPWVKILKLPPENIANTIGNYLKDNFVYFENFEVIKGFINFTFSNEFILKYAFNPIKFQEKNFRKVLIEFCSPNTNKPLHLGHVRNILLGDSLSKIMLFAGDEVVKLNLVNDRGIHICKSMLAYKKWGNNVKPESLNIKGDKLVGDFYVMFEKEYKKQIAELVEKGYTKEEAEKQANLIVEAQELLRKWENKDNETLNLWREMNSWVYNGFEQTYKMLNVSFDHTYYESETFELGKKYVYEGLSKGIFYKKPDGSIWVDLTDSGLDEKLLLRADGTSVYITQDIGNAVLRYEKYKPNLMIYVVGNEQNYHFQVLKLVLKKLGYHWADIIYHLSYGMVELPEGKMKSREGTVVDADDLINELIDESKNLSLQLGKLKDASSDEFNDGVKKIALSALKYFILKVDPEKNMTFNPKESIDFDGNTGPFILYTYSRIQSLLKKAKELNIYYSEYSIAKVNEKEKELLKLLVDFTEVFKESYNEYNPSKIANYVYTIAKEYNQYYQIYPILKEEDPLYRNFRIKLSEQIGEMIAFNLQLLGIQTIDVM